MMKCFLCFNQNLFSSLIMNEEQAGAAVRAFDSLRGCVCSLLVGVQEQGTLTPYPLINDMYLYCLTPTRSLMTCICTV